VKRATASIYVADVQSAAGQADLKQQQELCLAAADQLDARIFHEVIRTGPAATEPFAEARTLIETVISQRPDYLIVSKLTFLGPMMPRSVRSALAEVGITVIVLAQTIQESA
jgi:hypothetical protein